MLLDEPFGALDAKVRKELRSWLRQLHDEVHLTSVFVTHDQEEAMEVADEIVVMNQGKIEQVGTAAEIYDHPATPFVMGFIGEVNVLPRSASLFENHTFDPHHVNTAETPHVFVRPHDFNLQTVADEITSAAAVKRITHLGWEIQVELLLADQELVVAHISREQFADLRPEIGKTLFIKPRQTRIFSLVS